MYYLVAQKVCCKAECYNSACRQHPQPPPPPPHTHKYSRFYFDPIFDILIFSLLLIQVVYFLIHVYISNYNSDK
jgi:hypothetical protein